MAAKETILTRKAPTMTSTTATTPAANAIGRVAGARRGRLARPSRQRDGARRAPLADDRSGEQLVERIVFEHARTLHRHRAGAAAARPAGSRALALPA